MKKTPLKKQSKQKISVLQRKLWEECKRIIRARYPNVCYTCDAYDLEKSNWHTGHMWAKGGLHALLKYDLRILRPQCYHCNINLGGMGAVFYKRMSDENGIEYMLKLEEDKIRDKRDTLKAYDHYVKLFEEYKTIKN